MTDQERWDRFAAAALAGVLAAPGDVGESARIMPDKAAEWSAQFADAMMAEIGKRGEPESAKRAAAVFKAAVALLVKCDALGHEWIEVAALRKALSDEWRELD